MERRMANSLSVDIMVLNLDVGEPLSAAFDVFKVKVSQMKVKTSSFAIRFFTI